MKQTHTHSYLAEHSLGDRMLIAAKANHSPRYEPPEDARAAFFEPPDAGRAHELTTKLIAERDKDKWRPVRQFTSVSEGDAPEVNDPLPGAKPQWQNWAWTITGLDLFWEKYLMIPTGAPRTSHTGLVSSSFAFHPLWGTGHLLRTNGVIAIFWNGEEVAIVETRNVLRLPVLLDSDKPLSKRAQAIAAAQNED